MTTTSKGSSTTDFESKYWEALFGLEANTRHVFGHQDPVLIEGGYYPGIWLECGPLEGLTHARVRPEVGLANHEIFFHHQREDGYLPCYVWANELGTGQIQMVVPLAATALEMANWGGDEAFLDRATRPAAAGTTG